MGELSAAKRGTLSKTGCGRHGVENIGPLWGLPAGSMHLMKWADCREARQEEAGGEGQGGALSAVPALSLRKHRRQGGSTQTTKRGKTAGDSAAEGSRGLHSNQTLLMARGR